MKNVFKKFVMVSIGITLAIGVSVQAYSESRYSLEYLTERELPSGINVVKRYGDILIISEMVSKETTVNGETSTSLVFVKGMMDIYGNTLIEPQYNEIKEVADGYFSILAGENGSYTYGLADSKGNMVIKPTYSYIGQGYEGLFPVRKSGVSGVGYIDVNEKVVIPFSAYNSSSGFYDGLAVNTECPVNENIYGFIDMTGKKVIDSMYEKARNFSEGLAKVQIDGKCGFINTSNKLVVPAIYDQLTTVVDSEPVFTNGYCAVSKNGKWGYVDQYGNEVSAFIYSSAADVSEGVGMVSQTVDGVKKYGYIDMKGNTITPCIYKTGEAFSCERALVSSDTGYGYITNTGEVLVDLYLPKGCESFSEDVASAKSAYGLTVYVGKEGETVTEGSSRTSAEFDSFEDGLAVVTIGSEVFVIRNPLLESDYEYEEAIAIVANPTSAKVKVNEKEVQFDAYEIDGNNYFKLRDVAKAISDSENKFAVGYDNSTRTVTITCGEDYVGTGTELQAGDGGQKNAYRADTDVYVDGVKTTVINYAISGYGYYQLRELGELIGFGVEWDSSTSTIVIRVEEKVPEGLSDGWEFLDPMAGMM